MTITDWIESQGFGGMTKLMRESGLSYSSVLKVVHEGHTFKELVHARAMSKGTGGAVPVRLLWRPAVQDGAAVPRQPADPHTASS